ncbi:unnamed protein product [Symbiodinium sp. CCMP2592]|nr:unnamed protein product [Symbiodinium sp. CCMP2592]
MSNACHLAAAQELLAFGTATALLSQLTWASANFVQAHTVLLLYTSHLAATKQWLAICVATTLLRQLAWAAANFVHGHAALLLHALHLTAAEKSLTLGIATTLCGQLAGASTGLVRGHAALFLNALHLAAAKKSLALCGAAALLSLLRWASANALLRYALPLTKRASECSSRGRWLRRRVLSCDDGQAARNHQLTSHLCKTGEVRPGKSREARAGGYFACTCEPELRTEVTVPSLVHPISLAAEQKHPVPHRLCSSRGAAAVFSLELHYPEHHRACLIKIMQPAMEVSLVI